MSTGPHSRLVGFSFVAVALSMGATACDSRVEDGILEPSTAGVLEEIVHAAQKGGAGTSQMEVLDAALEAGDMTFEDLSSLVLELEGCVAVTGATMTIDPPTEVISGVRAPSFSFSAPATEDGRRAMELVEECLTRHYSFASAFYLSQPSTIRTYEDSIARDREAILACLGSHGVPIDDDATTDEIIQAVIDDFANAETQEDWYPCLAGDTIVQPR